METETLTPPQSSVALKRSRQFDWVPASELLKKLGYAVTKLENGNVRIGHNGSDFPFEYSLENGALVKRDTGKTLLPLAIVISSLNCTQEEAEGWIRKNFRREQKKRLKLHELPPLRLGYFAVPFCTGEEMTTRPLTNADRVYLRLCRELFGWRVEDKYIMQKDIVEATHMNKSEVSRAFAELERRDWIECSDDGKVQLVLPANTTTVVPNSNNG